MSKVKMEKFDGPCPSLTCFEDGPHEHPVCPKCGAVGYRVGTVLYNDCASCAAFRALRANAQLPAESTADYLRLLGKVDRRPHPETIKRWAREGLIERVEVKGGEGRGRPAFHFATQSLEAFRPPTPGGRRGKPNGGIRQRSTGDDSA